MKKEYQFKMVQRYKWQLEVFKFSLYIFAPVAAFYYFHRIENFEDKIEEYHRKHITAKSIKNEEMIKDCAKILRERRDQKFKVELESLRATEENQLKQKLNEIEQN